MDRPRNKRITVFGGSGFVGTQLVQRLARAGHRVLVAVRRPDLAGHLVPLGGVGQVIPIQANLRNRASVERAVAGSDIVVNLTGIGIARGKQRFEAINDEGAANVAEAARAAGVARLVHVSALGLTGKSAYAHSKRDGEGAVRAAFPEAAIVRPSIVFGAGDSFFNLWGTLARYLPVLPLIHGETRFQPVYVGDVAEAIARLALDPEPRSGVWELGGPEIETHRALIARVQAEAGRSRPLVPLAPAFAKILAAPLGILPWAPLLTVDRVDQLGTDAVVSEAAIAEGRTLEGLGISPVAMDTILPSYLWRFRKHGQFDRPGTDDPGRTPRLA